MSEHWPEAAFEEQFSARGIVPFPVSAYVVFVYVFFPPDSVYVYPLGLSGAILACLEAIRSAQGTNNHAKKKRQR